MTQQKKPFTRNFHEVWNCFCLNRDDCADEYRETQFPNDE